MVLPVTSISSTETWLCAMCAVDETPQLKSKLCQRFIINQTTQPQQSGALVSPLQLSLRYEIACNLVGYPSLASSII